MIEASSKTCIVCQSGAATGTWQLCPECRREIADRSARRQATMAPDHMHGLFPAEVRSYRHLVASTAEHCRRRFGGGKA